jgi:2'-5' RNA ligase
VGTETAEHQAPFIITLALDPDAQAHFDALRRLYFPPERLVVDAHITMFHALPATAIVKTLSRIEEICRAKAPFRVTIDGNRFLGRGVAFSVEAPEAHAIRALLADEVMGLLTRQDSARWAPHITIQNKVSPELARQTLSDLAGITHPAEIIATGLSIWRYLGGPWALLKHVSFRMPC